MWTIANDAGYSFLGPSVPPTQYNEETKVTVHLPAVPVWAEREEVVDDGKNRFIKEGKEFLGWVLNPWGQIDVERVIEQGGSNGLSVQISSAAGEAKGVCGLNTDEEYCRGEGHVQKWNEVPL